MIQTKRIYDGVDDTDGTRILIDRLWPRGIAKDDAQLDDWMQDIAPSHELREWFDHDQSKWRTFKQAYQYELTKQESLITELCNYAQSGTLTLLYAASDQEHNNAIVLRDYIQDQLGPQTTD